MEKELKYARADKAREMFTCAVHRKRAAMRTDDCETAKELVREYMDKLDALTMENRTLRRQLGH